MKKIAIMAAVAAAALMAAPVASAQVYGNLGYTQYDFDDSDVQVGGPTARVGYQFNPNFAIEGEGTFGTDDDGGVELNNALGAYAVGRVPLGSSFDVHGRVGYQTIDLDTPLGGVDDDGVGYGVGVGWQATPGIGIRADYTRFDGDLESDAVSLTGTMSF